LKQTIRVILSVAISFVLVGALVENYQNQSEANRRVAEMEKKLDAASEAHSAGRPTTVSPVILESGPSGSELVRKQHDLDEIVHAGWKLIDLRKPEQAATAVEIFKEGLAKVDPSSPELYNGLGRALLIAGKPAEAIVAWQRGLALSPKFSDMQSGIGWAYWWLNDPSRAKTAWQKAIDLNTHSVDAWSAMAWIDLALGKYREATEGFQELVNFDNQRQAWVLGLSMARGHNNGAQEIAQLFSLPPLDVFNQPLPVDPASARATNSP
jgi:tetratricopeptide (TPR) repeat protein